MAKRKRVNKRVVVVWIALGVILAVFAVTVLLKKSSRDPDKYGKIGDEALARSKEAWKADNARKAVAAAKQADKAYKVAVANAFPPKASVPYLYKRALVQRELLRDRRLTGTERAELVGQLFGLLSKAVLLDETHPDALRMLCDLHWERSWAVWKNASLAMRRLPVFIDQADQLLSIADDHKTLFRRARARARMAQLDETDPDAKQAAMADFRAVIKGDPNNVDYRLKLIQYIKDAGGTQQEILAEYDVATKAISNKAELRVDYAGYLRKISMNEEAMDQIKEAIQRDPNNPVAYLSLAERYSSEKQYPRALEALDNARKVAPTDPRVYGMLAQTHKRMKNSDKAVESVRQGLKLASDEAGLKLPEWEIIRLVRARAFLNYLLATLLLEELGRTTDDAVRTRNIAETKTCLKAISSLAPDSVFHTKIEGHLAFVQGQISKAIPLLEKSHDALRQRGAKMDAHTANLLVMAYIAAGRPTKAERILEALSQFEGEENNPSTLYSRAQLHMLMREYRQAEELANRILRVNPKYGRAVRMKVVLNVLLRGRLKGLVGDIRVSQAHMHLLLQRVEELWTRQMRQKALALALALREKAPKNGRLALLLVKMYQETEQHDKAETIINEVAETNPIFADELRFQGELLDESDRDKRFEMLIIRAEEYMKDPVVKILTKVKICERYGRQKELAIYLEKAREIAPRDFRVATRSFEHALKTGNMEKAKEWAKVAAQISKDPVSGKIYGARLNVAKGNFGQAAVTLEEILVKWPDSKYARTLLGSCYIGLKEHDRAESAFRRVLALDRSHLNALIGMARVTALSGKSEESDDWVEQAYSNPVGRRNPYVWEQYMRIAENKGIPRTTREVIYHRELKFKKDPTNLGNVFRLGRLYERNKQGSSAKNMYLYLFAKAPNKLGAVGPLLAYYSKTGQKSEVLKVFGELNEKVDDKVAVAIAVGNALMDYDPAQAEAAYRSAVDKGPNDTRGRRALGYLLARQKKFGLAAEQLEQCLKIKPQDRMIEDDLILYQINARKKDLMARAAKRLEAILARNAQDWSALALRGLLAFRQGRTDDALRYLDAAVKEAPATFIQPRRYRAEVYRARGEHMRARDDLKQLRRLTDSVDIVRSYARTCQEAGDFQSAKAAYLDALKRRKQDPQLLRGLMDLYLQEQRWKLLEALLAEKEPLFADDPDYFLTQYRMWIARSDGAKAIAALESALRVSTDSKLPGVVRTSLLAFLNAQRYDRALALCRQHQGKSAFAGWLGGAKAWALAGKGKRAEAEATFLDAMKVSSEANTSFIFQLMTKAYGPQPALVKLAAWTRDELAKHLDAHVLLGNVFIQNKRYPEALAAFAKARTVAKTPEEKAMVASSLGLGYQTTRKYLLAEKAYLEVLELFPDHLEVLNNIAYLYADEMNRAKDALDYAKRAFDRAPGNPAIVDTYGWTLAKLNRWPEAQDILSQVVQLGQSGGTFRFHLGRANEENDLLDAAILQYKDGLRLAKAANNTELTQQIQEALDRTRDKRPQENRE